MSVGFRCSASSAERGETLVGTASPVRAFLLVEVPGPWGVDALRENTMPQPVRDELLRRCRRHRVRPLLIRRHGRSSPTSVTVFAARPEEHDPWVERASLGSAAEVLDLDLGGFAAGRSPGLTPHHEPLFLVCTHGRHDVCCAERGRPVARVLSESHPASLWEVSHIGGDRFAGNVLVLPDGLYYGRVAPDDAQLLAEQHLAGELLLSRFRGRCSYSFPVQAAEIFLRREIGVNGIASLALRSLERTGRDTVAVFTEGGESWSVGVRTERGATTRLTCRAERGSPPLEHRLSHLHRLAPGD